jgi:hypothetical protein
MRLRRQSGDLLGRTVPASVPAKNCRHDDGAAMKWIPT